MRGIRSRITFTYLILIGLALSISGVFILQLLENVKLEQVTQTLQEEGQLTVTWLRPYFASPAATRSDMMQQAEKTAKALGKEITLFDSRGKLFFDSQGNRDDGPDQPEVKSALTGFVGKDIRENEGLHTNFYYVAVPVKEGPHVLGIVRVGVPFSPIVDTLQHLWGRVGIGFLLVGIATAFVSLYFSHKLAQPIEEINRVVRRIAEGDVNERVRFRSSDELGEVSESINVMASKIAQQIEDLTQEKSKLEGILTHMDSGVIVVDRSGNIKLINPAFGKIFEVQEEKFLGRWHWECLRSYGLSSMIDDVILHGEVMRKEMNVYAPVERTLEVIITPIQGKHETIMGAVAVLHDISQWRRLERMRSEFVANVSHELRTPITAVRGFAETLLDGALADPDTAKQFVQIIYDESSRLSRLVSDLLDLSQIEHNRSIMRMETIDVVQLLRSTFDKLCHQAEQNGLTLVGNWPEHPVSVEADSDRIAQVMINLVANAITYTPKGGEISAWMEEGDDHVTVHVKDTGIGIPPQDIDRLFERFYRVDKARHRRSGGTGLGLAIVKHILEAHHGTIQVQSEVGKGSDFAFTLPKKQPDPMFS
ncbi:PAS domain-containing sensor histidine kinase [Collibacillus ludicampi]|uniref:histidine kinase n=1 Tax=Collibacillus ludicampi TaxID=2771369 RepID=A0AAV4LCN2_9BACL|nr:ATP-binding protein [Collibacillus ludicampi]GIM45533.1 PAS domain-containing sensor histidine kinase [Collibacillus ludicampi]